MFAQFAPTLKHPIRGLVNCVGVSENWPVVEFPPDKFKRLFDINVAGTFIVAQAVAREVIKANVSASMVFIGSISGSVSNRVRMSDASRNTTDITRVPIMRDTILRKQQFCSSLDLWLQSGVLERAFR